MSSLIAETCPADDFLTPSKFVTGYDSKFSQERKDAKRMEGYKLGLTLVRFSIGENGVWSGQPKDGGHLMSYERIGYHSLTSEFLAGILDSGCEVWVYRRNSGPKRIK